MENPVLPESIIYQSKLVLLPLEQVSLIIQETLCGSNGIISLHPDLIVSIWSECSNEPCVWLVLRG